MRQSVYLHLAVLLIRLDIHREHEVFRRERCRILANLPHLSQHVLKDIGVERDGRMKVGLSTTPAERKVYNLRRRFKSRLIT
ncbi:hypothetical protein L4D77_08815 [Photobacterium frigidiphilum]|uniref:DUF1127 domain-containing protein n=1 Tax=Photobacterium frigidiphilum TaxID=264736 RepID=A0A2T3JB42_9GAMM|nr:hypothetical protein [Photobacterium frigidiphilum]PSU46078.1 hypothetical protein C9J12_19660 [Photobacterium frigidiphilum]